jgi:choline dehydrogenase-like flavoprotein
MADVAQGFDYVVVGGGTAGCALAARLSEEFRRTVCLLEAGGSGQSVFINVPGTLVMAQRSASLNWRFQSVPQPQLDGRRISVPRGRGLGGSALINGMVYFRGNPRDYDAWASAGATGWSYREILPYFRKSEHNENFGSSVYHGRGGPMNVRSVTRPNPLNFSFFEALAGLGYSYRDDLNGADSEGMSLRQLSIRGGTRETTANALLRPALGRPNLVVLTGTQATGIVLEGRRAVAVEARSAGGSLVVKAHREIVLAAGAIQSP